MKDGELAIRSLALMMILARSSAPAVLASSAIAASNSLLHQREWLAPCHWLAGLDA